MPAEANGLTLGQMDEDVYVDLAVAAGNRLVIIHGRDRKLSLDKIRQREVLPAVFSQRSFPFAIDSIAIGDFTGGHQSELALLTADGTVQVLGGEGARSQRQAGLSAARLISSVSVSESAHLLVKARLSSAPWMKACGGCKPTTWISIICISRTTLCRWKNRSIAFWSAGLN